MKAFDRRVLCKLSVLNPETISISNVIEAADFTVCFVALSVNEE